VSRAWEVEGIAPKGTLAENARRILGVRIAEFYSYAPIVFAEHEIESLHNLRIAAKRLRYTLELFRSVFGPLGEEMIEQIKAIQEELGNLHDADVRIAIIINELTALSAEQTEELGRLLTEAPLNAHDAIAATVLRPPPDDPRRGLVALLGRVSAQRKTAFEAFLSLWRAGSASGLRGKLVSLSQAELLDPGHEVSSF
jgi:hypothetical protein